MTTKRLAIILVALVSLVQYVNGKTINTLDLSISPGQTREFYIYMNTTRTNIVSVQFDVKLPEGLSIQTKYCGMAPGVPDKTQKLYVGEVGEGVFRSLSTSYNLTPFATGNNAVFKLAVTADDTFKGGTVTLTNMFGVLDTAVRYNLIEDSFKVSVVDFVKGDVNYDGMANISDVMSTIDYVLKNNQLYSSTMDINEDGEVDLTDIMELVDHILTK